MVHKAQRTDSLPRPLDGLILRALLLRDLRGYGIVQLIQRSSANELVEEGSLYPTLQRLELNGWIDGVWGVTSNHRRARIYKITTAGRNRLDALTLHAQTSQSKDSPVAALKGFSIVPPIRMRCNWRGLRPATCPQPTARRDSRERVHGAHSGTSGLYQPCEIVSRFDLFSNRRGFDLAYGNVGL